MKRANLMYVVMLMLMFVYVGCSKDPLKPVITLHELGENNSGEVVQGEELHVDAEIEAEGVIEVVIVEIHFEGTGTGWEYEKIHTEFSGLKNADFHKHIDVPVDAAPGDYHFHLKVRDKVGQETSFEAELTIKSM